MATTSDGIWTPDSVDTFALVNDLAAMAASIQTALTRRANSYTGTTSQREAFTATAPEGTLWSDTNGEKILWIKQGASWRAIPATTPDESVVLTLAYGWAPAGGQPPTVNRSRGQVFLAGITVRAAGRTDPMSIATIPAGFRPPRKMFLPVHTFNGGSTVGPQALITLDADGSMRLEVAVNATWTESTWFYMPATPWIPAA